MIWPLVIAIVINGAIALYARRFRRVPASSAFSFLLALGALTALNYAFEITVTMQPLRIFLAQFRFLFLAPVSVALLVFVLEYLGLGHRLSRLRLAALYLIPAITIVMSLSGAYHHLFRYDFQLIETDLVAYLIFKRGPWWYVYFLYGLITELLAIILLLASFRSPLLRYLNTLAITMGLTLAIAVDILYVLRLTPVPGYYWTPSMFVLTGGLFAWGVLRGCFLNFAPVARDVVIEGLDDIVIVLDAQDYLVDFNPAARAVCGLTRASLGAGLEQALSPAWSSLFLSLRSMTDWRSDARIVQELTLPDPAAVSPAAPGSPVYELTSLPVLDKRHRRLGRLFLFHDITRRKQMEQALSASEERFRRLFDTAPIAIIVLQHGKISIANPAAGQLVGAENPRDLAGQPYLDFIPPARRAQAVERADSLTSGVSGVPMLQQKFLRLDGSSFDGEVTSVAISYAGQPAIQSMIVDVTKRLRAEEKLKTALAEKETLLREIHHRVKNNLAIVSSLLSMQERISKDERVQAAFQNSQARLRAMAAIHEQLYRSDSLARIDMSKYISGMVKDLRKAYATFDVAMQVDVQGVFLDIDQTIPCGLILNELLTNALKYAFPAARDPALQRSIRLEMHPQDACYTLQVSDNGCGLPAGLDIAASRSLGLKLVNQLVHQLQGQLQVESAPQRGVMYRISFPAH